MGIEEEGVKESDGGPTVLFVFVRHRRYTENLKLRRKSVCGQVRRSLLKKICVLVGKVGRGDVEVDEETNKSR